MLRSGGKRDIRMKKTGREGPETRGERLGKGQIGVEENQKGVDERGWGKRPDLHGSLGEDDFG